MISRRMLLAGASALALAGCATTEAQIQSDVAAIAAGLSAVLTALKGLVPDSILAKATTLLNTIEANAALIGQAISPNASTLQTISDAISALAALLSPFFPMAPGIAAAVQAALALISVVLTAAGVFPTVPTPAKAEFLMSADSARAILRAAAAGGIKR